MTAGRYDAIVIGAGANGLAAAAMLAKRRRRVLVLERADEIGGMCRTVEIAPGVRAPLSFDCGWMSSNVASALGLRVPPMTAPMTSIAVRDGDGWLSLPTGVGAAAARIRARSPRDADRWPELVVRLEQLATFLGSLYESPPPDIATTSLADLASLAGLGRRFRSLGRAAMTDLLRVLPMSIQDFLDDELETAALKAAIAAGGVRDLRQGPRSGGTTFNLLHYLVGAPPGSVRARAWWSESPTALIHALEQLARKRRVEVRTSTAVARITARDDSVTGVVLANGDELQAPLVVSTADPRTTLLHLVEPMWLDPEFLHAVKHIKFRGTTAVCLYHLDALPQAEGLGDAEWSSIISLSSTVDSIERAYDAVKYGRASETPHIELTAPSLRWPTLTTDGRHVVTARVQYVPATLPPNAELAQRITGAIDAALPGFRDRIVAQRLLLPSELSSEFALADGALTHGELTLDQILFMRPVAGWGRYAMPIKGLYLGGAGANPGPGFPGVAGVMAARAARS